MSGGSESVSSLPRVFLWTGTISLAAAAQEFVKPAHHKNSLSIQSFLQVYHRLIIGVVMIVQHWLVLPCHSAVSVFRHLGS